MAGLLGAAALTTSFTGSAAALPGPSQATAGKGFDTCTAPASDVMDTWRASSPYEAVGIYIGGVNRECAQPLLTAQWVSAQEVSAGWHLLLIYLGLQPYCTTSTKSYLFTAADAATSGRVAAGDAVVQVQALGLGTGATIFSDIEAYSPTDSACTTAVLTYQSQ